MLTINIVDGRQCLQLGHPLIPLSVLISDDLKHSFPKSKFPLIFPSLSSLPFDRLKCLPTSSTNLQWMWLSWTCFSPQTMDRQTWSYQRKGSEGNLEAKFLSPFWEQQGRMQPWLPLATLCNHGEQTWMEINTELSGAHSVINLGPEGTIDFVLRELVSFAFKPGFWFFSITYGYSYLLLCSSLGYLSSILGWMLVGEDDFFSTVWLLEF